MQVHLTPSAPLRTVAATWKGEIYMLRKLCTVLVVSVSVAMVLNTTPADALNAYITNVGANTISVIDTANNTVTATIPSGALPFGVAVTPDGATVYVTNEIDNTVSVVDTAKNTVAATIPAASSPLGAAG